MKKSLFMLTGVLLAAQVFGQSYDSPESIEFDYDNNRWLIANTDADNILARSSSNGAVTVLVPSVNGSGTGPHGLEIVNDTLYACGGGSIYAFNVNTGAPIFNMSLGASFLNGITHDSSGNLYITDFSAKKIYKFNTTLRTYTTFVASLGTASPNGIICDEANNRCIFVTWGSSAQIKAADLTTGAVSTVLFSTLGNCDGITRDNAGNYYVSSWTGNKITRYTSTFTSPVTVVSGLSSPADIFYNVLTDTLGNPNSGTLNNTTYHYFGTSTSIEEIEDNEIMLSPNPATDYTMVSYTLKAEEQVELLIYDVKGSLVKSYPAGSVVAGSHSILLPVEDLPSSQYTVVIRSTSGERRQKLVLIR
jgi:sugar lactone lactonase YvrE